MLIAGSLYPYRDINDCPILDMEDEVPIQRALGPWEAGNSAAILAIPAHQYSYSPFQILLVFHGNHSMARAFRWKHLFRQIVLLHVPTWCPTSYVLRPYHKNLISSSCHFTR